MSVEILIGQLARASERSTDKRAQGEREKQSKDSLSRLLRFPCGLEKSDRGGYPPGYPENRP